jgi:protein involved in plasmid replication-relaxation
MTAEQAHGRTARLRARLSERDLEVLRSLYRLRLLTSSQVRRLHLTTGSPQTRARRTRALLQRQQELGLLVALDRRVGGVQPGSSATVYGLSGLGLAVLDFQGPRGGRRRRATDTKPYFMFHVLAVSELAVALAERTRETGAELLVFDGEPAAWRKYSGPDGAPAVLKPDAYAVVGLGDDLERSVFAEVDLASESLPTIERKCAQYLAFWRSGMEQREHGVFPLVMWLVPNEARRKQIQAVIDRLNTDTRRLFVVALQRDGAALLTSLAEDES